MMEACDILNILRSKNSENPNWINRNLYRILYMPKLHMMAYERQKSKPGNMTAGSDGETLDGYSWETIEQNIELLKSEQYQPHPVRRKQIPKEQS
jgi:retron-type reverse transcriptase